MADLFAYGSLMFPVVWQQIVPRARAHCPAFLPGYSRRLIFLDTYPLLVADQNTAGIVGTLYKGLRADDLARLDYFEGEIYQRSSIAVHTEEGVQRCQTYVPHPKYTLLARQDAWRGDFFRRLQLPLFLARYCSKNLPIWPLSVTVDPN